MQISTPTPQRIKVLARSFLFLRHVVSGVRLKRNESAPEHPAGVASHCVRARMDGQDVWSKRQHKKKQTSAHIRHIATQTRLRTCEKSGENIRRTLENYNTKKSSQQFTMAGSESLLGVGEEPFFCCCRCVKYGCLSPDRARVL